MEAATMAWTAAAAGIALSYWFVWVMGAAEVKGKRAVDLKMGSITNDKVKDKYSQYWSFFRRPKETAAAATAEKVPAFVDTFYNLVTDIYEWGWGQSFHFSPSLPGRSHREETRVHEERVADLLEARPGHRLLDVGCGVGGPMRAIAAHSGADVVGITINEYQVNSAHAHNRKAGLDTRCEVVHDNFLAMPFPDASFDGAYSIEAIGRAAGRLRRGVTRAQARRPLRLLRMGDHPAVPRRGLGARGGHPRHRARRRAPGAALAGRDRGHQEGRGLRCAQGDGPGAAAGAPLVDAAQDGAPQRRSTSPTAARPASSPPCRVGVPGIRRRMRCSI